MRISIVGRKKCLRLQYYKNIHSVKWNGTEWKNYIHFRDYLNANENVALQYEKLKEELESKYADDRVAYTNGKQNMINKILGK